MKNVIKKAISVLLVAVMVFGAAPLSGLVGLELPDVFDIKASAVTEGYYTYSVSGNNATINDVDSSISGNITIPAVLGYYQVTGISDYAFYNCSKLTSILIPPTVKIIGNSAFSYCSNLESVTIPYGVTMIGNSAFYECTSLKSITIPDSVTTLGAAVFRGCSSLESVTLSDNITVINHQAFLGCTSLKSITIPDGVTAIGNNAFNYCMSLESITIPEGVTYIGSYSFAYCDSLTSIKIGEGVTRLEECVFGYCPSLKNIYLPKSIEYIDMDVFFETDNIENIYYGGSELDLERITFFGPPKNVNELKKKFHCTSSDKTDNTPDYDFLVIDSSLVPTPTQTTISYGDSIVLHVDPSKIPVGGKAEWYPSNQNFGYSASSDGTTCTITPEKKGDTTFTAIVYDSEGNIVSADEQTMTSKAGLFQKIIAFFKKLFGLTKTIPEAIKVIY